MRALAITARCRRDLKQIPNDVLEEVYEIAQVLRTTPESATLGVKKLVGVRGSLYRVRIGSWRLVYSFTRSSVLLRRFAHRREIYEGL